MASIGSRMRKPNPFKQSLAVRQSGGRVLSVKGRQMVRFGSGTKGILLTKKEVARGRLRLGRKVFGVKATKRSVGLK